MISLSSPWLFWNSHRLTIILHSLCMHQHSLAALQSGEANSHGYTYTVTLHCHCHPALPCAAIETLEGDASESQAFESAQASIGLN